MRKSGILMWLILFIASLPGIGVAGIPPVYGPDENHNGEETVVFFIPEDPDNEISAYIYDSERNHLLVSSYHQDPVPAGLPGNRNTEEWIVLPGNVRAYTSASYEAQTSNVVLSYPQKIESFPGDSVKKDGHEWIAFRHNGTVLYLPAPLVARRPAARFHYEGNIPIGSQVVDRYTGLPPDYEPDDLVLIDQRWNFHKREYPKYLRSEAAAAIEDLLKAARNQGIQIRLFSAYRSYRKQRFLYLRKIEKEGLNQILVAKPGHSEHQLGTAVDLCGLNPESAGDADFGRTREGHWLMKNSDYYGFIQSYRRDNTDEHGYAPEPWHYRYMGRPKRKSDSAKPRIRSHKRQKL